MPAKIPKEKEEAILQKLRDNWQEYAKNGFSFLSFIQHEAGKSYEFVRKQTTFCEEFEEEYNKLKNASCETASRVSFLKLARNGQAKLDAGEMPESMEFAAMQELQKRGIHAEKAAIEREKIKAAKELAENGNEGNMLVFGLRDMTKDELETIKGNI